MLVISERFFLYGIVLGCGSGFFLSFFIEICLYIILKIYIIGVIGVDVGILVFFKLL